MIRGPGIKSGQIRSVSTVVTNCNSGMFCVVIIIKGKIFVLIKMTSAIFNIGHGLIFYCNFQEAVLNIDFAPTFVDLAGISPIPPKIDGQTFKSLLFSNASEVSWREDFLVEHKGEFKETVSECPRLNHQQVAVGQIYYANL